MDEPGHSAPTTAEGPVAHIENVQPDPVTAETAARPVTPGRRARHRRRRRYRGLIVAGVALLLLVLMVGADFVVYRNRIHPGVGVRETPLGAHTLPEAAEALEERAADLARRRVRFEWEGQVFQATIGDLGWRPDAGATAAETLRVGHDGPLWEDAWTRAKSWVWGVEVPWQGTWDESSTRGVVRAWADEVAIEPVEGSVEAPAGVIDAHDPVPGRRIRIPRVVKAAEKVVTEGSGGSFALPVAPVPPATTAADVAGAEQQVEALLDGPLGVRIGEVQLKLTPKQLGPLVRTTVVGDGADAELRVFFGWKLVEELLSPYRSRAEVPPRSAQLDVVGGHVQITPSVPGKALDAKVATRVLLKIAAGKDRSGRVPLVVEQPELTTKKAKALGITQRISGFTTYHSAGEPRVQNIHLAADFLNGALVMPGETFSLNGRVAARTADRGFVEAPVIYNGEFTTDIGGGTSQLATTTFNAAFFAGYPFVEYQPHSYYISRYPMGREATVSWPKPDLRFTNDTDTAALIVTSYTESSITVQIWGTKGGRSVEATPPKIVQQGGGRFTVVVDRIVKQNAEVVLRQTFTTSYRSG